MACSYDGIFMICWNVFFVSFYEIEPLTSNGRESACQLS